MTPILTEIVKRCLLRPTSDIGQFTHEEVLQLNRAVRHGYLSKGKGGPYSNLKTVYAVPGFDFAADRQAHIDMAMRIADYEKAHQLGPYHPMFKRNRVSPDTNQQSVR
jgi:hypothetical protein